MSRRLILLFIIFRGTAVLAQEEIPVSRHLLRSWGYKGLALALTKNCASDSEKAVRIAAWIVQHIRYDTRYLVDQKDRGNTSNKVLRRRKATSRGYSLLFHQMCESAGVQNAMIYGYGKDWFFDPGDRFYCNEFYWSAYSSKSRWHLLDLRMAAGHIEIRYGKWRKLMWKMKLRKFPFAFKFTPRFNPRYFSPSPEQLAYDHCPVYAPWQLSDDPFSIALFSAYGFSLHDSLYTLHNRHANEQPYCGTCDDLSGLKDYARLSVESREQLKENEKNVFFFLRNNYDVFDSISKDRSGDSLRMKDRLATLDSMLVVADSGLLYVRRDYAFHMNKNKEKVRCFYGYMHPLLGEEKKNLRAMSKIYKGTHEVLGYYRKSYARQQIELKRGMTISLKGITPKPLVTKKMEKRKKRYEHEMNAHLYHALFTSYDRADDQLWSMDTLFEDTDSAAWLLLNHRLSIQIRHQDEMRILRMDFMDQYDRVIFEHGDSVKALSDSVVIGIKRLVKDITRMNGNIRRYVEWNQKCIDELIQAKKYCRKAARNDFRLKDWRETMGLLDTIMYFLDTLNREDKNDVMRVGKFTISMMKKVLPLNDSLVKLSLKEQFYDQCRSYYTRSFFHTRYKQQKREATQYRSHISRKRNVLISDLKKIRKKKKKN
jgi:hypothetical protein